MEMIYAAQIEETIMAAMDCLPVGYRFHPTKEERLCHYLWRKNSGIEEPVRVIPEVNLCSWEPEELHQKFHEASVVQSKDLKLWFFCEQNPKLRTQPRSTRKGYWKKTGQTREITRKDNRKDVIGSKKILTFFRGSSSYSTRTDWVMHEYHLPANAFGGIFPENRKNYVLCVIKCSPDEMANSPSSYGSGPEELLMNYIDNPLEQEGEDYSSIPEYSIQQKMLWLLTDPVQSEPFPTQFSGGVEDSMGFNFQPFSDEDMDISNGSNRVTLLDRAPDSECFTRHHCLSFLFFLICAFFLENKGEVVIMENKQTQKLGSIHTVLPIDEQKGIVDDDSRRPHAPPPPRPPPGVMNSPKIVLPKYLEAKGLKQEAPCKIKAEVVSAGFSSTSIPKYRLPSRQATPVERQAATAITKKMENNTTAAPTVYMRQVWEAKATTVNRKPLLHSPSCSSSKTSSCTNVEMACFRNTLVGILLCIAIVWEIFDLQF
ncbi:hypothetical protein SAY87_024768 [Trapa incisa]|uniref:NAC domain-containing protein n=1 Tax=Trapa incisa TaxID=236973 RepID=A0AAN7GEW4_9MYRT|nr:hypothetical protein SAY87_024768 [Trapa incisa]